MPNATTTSAGNANFATCLLAPGEHARFQALTGYAKDLVSDALTREAGRKRPRRNLTVVGLLERLARQREHHRRWVEGEDGDAAQQD